jgi:hypothetical protein
LAVTHVFRILHHVTVVRHSKLNKHIPSLWKLTRRTVPLYNVNTSSNP